MRALLTGALFVPFCLPLLAGQEGGEWNALDEELDTVLQEATVSEPGYPMLSGFVRVDARYANDAETFGGEDLRDFRVANASLVLAGDVGEMAYRISYEMGDGFPGDLEDAYLSFPIPGELKTTLGQFKAPVVRSGLVEDDRTLFFAHTFLGQIFEARDQGVMLQRDWGGLRGAVAVQDGIDGSDTEYAFVGRVEVDVAGQGMPLVEGAYGAAPELNATLGAALLDDEGISEGVLFAVDGAVTYDRLAVAAEVVSADDGYDSAAAAGDPRSAIGDATPWSFTASYMLREDIEAGWRLDYLDTPDNTHIQTFGANYYLRGHDLKWQLSLTIVEPEGEDDRILGIGLSANF